MVIDDSLSLHEFNRRHESKQVKEEQKWRRKLRMTKKYLSVKKCRLSENQVKKEAGACSYWNNHTQYCACDKDVSVV